MGRNSLEKMGEEIRSGMADLMAHGKYEDVVKRATILREWCGAIDNMAATYAQTAVQARRLSEAPRVSKTISTKYGVKRPGLSGTMEECVEAVLRDASGPMTLRQVYEALSEADRAPTGKNPINSVYTYLSRLAAKKKVRRVGKSPVRYESMK